MIKASQNAGIGGKFLILKRLTEIYLKELVIKRIPFEIVLNL